MPEENLYNKAGSRFMGDTPNVALETNTAKNLHQRSYRAPNQAAADVAPNVG